MSKAGIRTRFVGFSIIIGGLLILIATVLHPPLVDPYDGETAFREFIHADTWMWDHTLMLGGMFLWLLGLGGSDGFFSDNNSVITRMGSCLFYVSLSLWILILTAELTILPLIGEDFVRKQDPILKEVWEAAFSFVLLGGYFAVACSWVGIALYGWGIRHSGIHLSKWFTNCAFYGGIIGFAGILLTFYFFKAGYVLLPLTSGPVYIWTLWLGSKMLKGFTNHENR